MLAVGLQAQELPKAQRKAFGKHVQKAEAKARALGLVLDYDKPPQPLKLERPQYADAAFRKGLNGDVLVMVVIDKEGGVVDAEVLESTPGFEAAALDCARAWRFKPAVKNGKPVGTVAAAPMTFRVH